MYSTKSTPANTAISMNIPLVKYPLYMSFVRGRFSIDSKGVHNISTLQWCANHKRSPLTNLAALLTDDEGDLASEC